MAERGAAIRPRSGRPKVKKYSMGLSARVREAIGLMISEGLPRKEAAAPVGISDQKLYEAFRNPTVAAFHKEQLAALRTSEQSRSLHALCISGSGASSLRRALRWAAMLPTPPSSC
jgi:hypothetical protein